MTIEMYVDGEPIELETKKIAEKVTQRYTYSGHLTWPVCIKRENGWNSAGIEREGKRGSFYTWWWWHGTIANLLHNGGVLLYPRHLTPPRPPIFYWKFKQTTTKKKRLSVDSRQTRHPLIFFPVFSCWSTAPDTLPPDGMATTFQKKKKWKIKS